MIKIGLHTSLLCCLLLFAMPTHAQKKNEARQLLDATAALIEQQNSAEVHFTLTAFNGLQQESATKGVLKIKGKKLHLDTPEMTTWYDGATQYTLLKNNQEVNVTTPTKEEMQQMNPYAFTDIYKKGYRCSVENGTLRGIPVKTVHLVAEKKKLPIRQLILDINPKTHQLMCVRLRQDKNWVRIAIHELKTGISFNDKEFEFHAADFPHAEVIDLR